VWPNIVIGTTIAFFPMVVNTARGMTTVDQRVANLMETLNASRWKIFRKLRLPNALPHIFVETFAQSYEQSARDADEGTNHSIDAA